MVRKSIPLFITAAVLLCAARADAQSQSANFRLQPAALNAGTGASTSATTQTHASLGQSLVVGASSSPHFVVQSGYWSFLGATLVPVVLAVNKVPAQPGAVDLAWSGNNAPYDIYRATLCATVYSGVFATTAESPYTDSSPPTEALTCYNVLATAPGPLPPAQGSPSP